MQYRFCVNIQKKERVDMFISALFWELSRSYIQKLIDTGCITVNEEKIKKNLKLQPRDEIFIEEIINSVEILPEDIALDIIYEDENICVINKNPDINVHPTPGVEGKRGTLVNALLHHCKENLPIISGEERPGIIHRLDKDTSWVILTAKNDKYMKTLSEKIKNREVKKYYIAIVQGVVTDKEFTIQSDIGRHRHDKIKMTTQDPINPKHAVTHAQLVWYIDNTYSVLKIDLETWRTHQIRVHLASIWYPIIGDKVYWNHRINTTVATLYQIHRQALHASEFHVSLYGEEKIFHAELKEDMQRLIEKISL